VVGQPLVCALVGAGHEVTGTTRSPAKAAVLHDLGATPVIVDGLNRQAVIDAVKTAQPAVIVHELTHLADLRSMRNFDRAFAVTNDLRTRGTDNLLEAARQAGTRRFIAQSYTGWNNNRGGGPVTTEDDPLDPEPLPTTEQALAAIRHVEDTVPAAVPEGLVLRYGPFYGHGASDFMLDLVRKRQLPVIGTGTGIWSFCEVTDAAAATAAAVTRGAPGLYQIVDDDPAPVREWLPYLSQCLGAKPPMHLPAWLGRILAGPVVVTMMTQARGAANAKAKRELGWSPGYPSWRDGFPDWVSGMHHA
jgi:nucleoside-diphosphate-sugar epimerase